VLHRHHLFGDERGEQTARRRLDQVECMIKARGATKEGVRHVLGRHMGRKLKESTNLGTRIRWRARLEVGIIGAIHDQQEIEPVEILVLYLSCGLAGNINAARSRGFLRSMVGGLPDMPIAKPGRIDLEASRQALCLDHAAKDAFGHGRAADIAEADEENAVGSHGGCLAWRGLPDKARMASDLAPIPGSLRSARPHPMSSRDFGFFSLGEDETMRAWDNPSDLPNAALGEEISLRNFAEWERRARTDFWSKLKRFAGQLPFMEDIVAGFYCALDPATPMRVRGMLLAAIAGFILPFDFIPDFIAGLGFADDAALVTAVLALVSAHITPTHRTAAARTLDKELPKVT
jgi:uncharacterized membrane protein YkvA (DUF1232 family)